MVITVIIPMVIITTTHIMTPTMSITIMTMALTTIMIHHITMAIMVRNTITTITTMFTIRESIIIIQVTTIKL